ncbi:hypothetical protein D3C87_1986070 [compost metagenome]
MLAGITQNVGEEIGGAVNDEMLFNELRNRGNEAVQLEDTTDFREVAVQGSLDLCENVDGAQFGGALGGCNVNIAANKARHRNLA